VTPSAESPTPSIDFSAALVSADTLILISFAI
jgi:hypothetical protein